jgi:phosphoketolase
MFPVPSYKEKGNINTPLDLAVLNQIDRLAWQSTLLTGCPHWKWPAPTPKKYTAQYADSLPELRPRARRG